MEVAAGILLVDTCSANIALVVVSTTVDEAVDSLRSKWYTTWKAQPDASIQ